MTSQVARNRGRETTIEPDEQAAKSRVEENVIAKPSQADYVRMIWPPVAGASDEAFALPDLVVLFLLFLVKRPPRGEGEDDVPPPDFVQREVRKEQPRMLPLPWPCDPQGSAEALYPFADRSPVAAVAASYDDFLA